MSAMCTSTHHRRACVCPHANERTHVQIQISTYSLELAQKRRLSVFCVRVGTQKVVSLAHPSPKERALEGGLDTTRPVGVRGGGGDHLGVYTKTKWSGTFLFRLEKEGGRDHLRACFMTNVPTRPPCIPHTPICGLATPLRMMCYYKRQSFNNVAYASDMATSWMGGKKTQLIKLNSCINLPYIIDGDTVVTQVSEGCKIHMHIGIIAVVVFN